MIRKINIVRAVILETLISVVVVYMLEEIWMPIKDFEDYLISNFGRVKSLKSKIILKQFEYRGGYLEVHLRKPGIKVHKKIHRLVAEAFLENPNNYPAVNHKDENKKNNHVDNLEWCSTSYNNAYNGRASKIAKHRYKSVAKYDLNGNLIKVYKSQTEAAKDNNTRQGGISDCVLGKIKTHKGFIWKLC